MNSKTAAERARVSTLALRDLLCCVAAVTAGLLTPLGAKADLADDYRRLFLAGAILILWPSTLWLSNSRATRTLGFGAEEFRRVINATLLTFALVAATAYLANITRSRSFVLFTAALGLTLLLLNRGMSRAWLRNRIRRTGAIHKVLAIGSRDWLRRTDLRFEASLGRYNIVDEIEFAPDCLPLPQYVSNEALRQNADVIAIAPDDSMGGRWVSELSWLLEGTQKKILIDAEIAGVNNRRIALERVNSLNLLSVEPASHSHPALPLKRLIDVVGSAIGLAILSPLFVILAISIRLDSPGPALFKQRRMGKQNQIFVCWKFRTMRVGADAERAQLRAQTESSGAFFKMQDDPRITGLGRLLRKYSIDELPQLINVLRGDMSLVGPRPHPLDDVERYNSRDRRRLLARPGMTGLWQVSGRSELSWEDAVGLDLEYVESWSMGLDFILLVRTVGVVFGARGSY